MLEISRFHTSIMGTNCYLIMDIESKELAVIDPGGISKHLLEEIETLGGNLKYILLTHGHFDHIGFVAELKEKYNPLIAIHKDDAEYTSNDILNLAKSCHRSVKPFKADIYISEGSIIELGKTQISVIHTPGHTNGSVCFLDDKNIFSGDTIFRGSVGRTDLENGDSDKLISSLKKLKQITGDYIIYPGHSAETTLASEKLTNPYLINV